MAPRPSSAFSRRGFIGLAAGAGLAGAATLTGCNRAASSGGGGGGGGKTALKFWNMPWGNDQFNVLDKKITTDYKPAEGLNPATYQVIQWANFTQTFSSAVASNTGPAVSSGGGTQAFQFESQGKIAYADDLLNSWKSNGLYDDFLPNLLDTMKVQKGYAAVPYNLDMRVMWYNKSLLEKAGADIPTDWDSYLKSCAALKKIGTFGYGTRAGAGAYLGSHALVCWMINNGGGLFNEGHEPEMVTDANVEAMDFVLELVKKGYSDPRAVSYSNDNGDTQWRSKKFAMGIDTAGLANNIGGSVGKDLLVMSPLTGPSGKKGALYFPNNIMMYTNTPSQKASEAFLTYYYKNMAQLWTKHTGIGLPPLKSISETAEFQQDANAVKAIKEWQPISHTWSAPGSDALFLGVTAVDGTPAMDTFTQSILGGKTTSKDALSKLQDAVAKTIKSLG
ncbi:extracellular solute-binding protein [Microlunatus elymi]|uniref:Extracellular solute-binding protein n=1 Tax=Microlunatus elymi TaxID=2596828 RepID=A0A516PU08_9ACTN|nr:extracellular solute-binding protein [Microlunatus elymi]QDP94633.1 extracellular solute-binding protein [Microlunatus elymi]